MSRQAGLRSPRVRPTRQALALLIGRLKNSAVPKSFPICANLSFLSRLLDEGEDVGDALVGIYGGDVVGVAAQNHQSGIGNESLVLQRLPNQSLR